MVASQRVVDRWHCIINGLCVAVKMGSHGPGCRLSVPEPSCERLMCRPAVGHQESFAAGGFHAFQRASPPMYLMRGVGALDTSAQIRTPARPFS